MRSQAAFWQVAEAATFSSCTCDQETGEMGETCACERMEPAIQPFSHAGIPSSPARPRSQQQPAGPPARHSAKPAHQCCRVGENSGGQVVCALRLAEHLLHIVAWDAKPPAGAGTARHTTPRKHWVQQGAEVMPRACGQNSAASRHSMPSPAHTAAQHAHQAAKLTRRF